MKSARLADLPDADAEALCERLARFHAALLPRVIAEWKAATSDRAKQRLLTLRYRLVASDLLMLTWPGGLERLASGEANVRHKAAEELVERASADDQPLLLELFKDPDPLVREISLRGLQHVSPGQTGGALAALLDDPDPNVRAAVLKQLADEPSAEMAAKVAAYVSREKDPDLLVHALRYLKGMPRADSVKAAIGLLKHPNWQVRAEAVDALSGLSADRTLGAALRSDASAALADLMDDPEPFVISRVFHGLIDNRIDVEADRLEKAADKHPELTADVISLLLGRWHNTSPKDVVVLRAFFKKPNSSVRAAILAGLNGGQAEAFSAEIVASLSDKSPAVREAAANLLFKAAGSILEAARSNRTVNQKAGEVAGAAGRIEYRVGPSVGDRQSESIEERTERASHRARSFAAMAEAIPRGRRRQRVAARHRRAACENARRHAGRAPGRRHGLGCDRRARRPHAADVEANRSRQIRRRGKRSR